MGENNINYSDENIDLKQLFFAVWKKKFFIGTFTLVSVILSAIIALNLPNTYTSKALLAPATTEDSLSSKLGNLSSFGNIAGFSLPSGSASKSQEAIERIKSFEFFSTYFLPNIKLENIMASKKWDSRKNILIYDNDLFDSNSKKWVRNISFPQKKVPSSQEAFKKYKEKVSVTEDTKTGFVVISIDHHSPFIAKNWIDIIIYQINESMRNIDAEKAEKSINYLNETASTNKIQSIKEVISKLLEDQIQTLMLTSSNESYIFKVIDSPVVSEENSKPNRPLILIFSTFLSIFISSFIVLIQHNAVISKH
ncbi:Wzz/FepE/Etk N-terminal domain-containing protein [Gammaproteobacteria bacterium]|nr:Wzz/FepE/Etk N-terminal domain-containing protein [Gammaproteobacteria bacterium]